MRTRRLASSLAASASSPSSFVGTCVGAIRAACSCSPRSPNTPGRMRMKTLSVPFRLMSSAMVALSEAGGVAALVWTEPALTMASARFR